MIEDWWPRLPDATRAWLIDHNGERLAAWVVDDIAMAAGGRPSPEWWAGGEGEESQLSDAAVDWIEETANLER